MEQCGVAKYNMFMEFVSEIYPSLQVREVLGIYSEPISSPYQADWRMVHDENNDKFPTSMRKTIFQ